MQVGRKVKVKDSSLKNYDFFQKSKLCLMPLSPLDARGSRCLRRKIWLEPSFEYFICILIILLFGDQLELGVKMLTVIVAAKIFRY